MGWRDMNTVSNISSMFIDIIQIGYVHGCYENIDMSLKSENTFNSCFSVSISSDHK